MNLLPPNEALYVLNGDRCARDDFIHKLAELVRGPNLRQVDGRLLTTVVFDKEVEEQKVAELQVDVAVKLFAADAVVRLQRALDSGSLNFRADFEKVETTADDWSDFGAEARLIGLSGWDGRAVLLYIRPDDELDRLRVEIH